MGDSARYTQMIMDPKLKSLDPSSSEYTPFPSVPDSQVQTRKKLYKPKETQVRAEQKRLIK